MANVLDFVIAHLGVGRGLLNDWQTELGLPLKNILKVGAAEGKVRGLSSQPGHCMGIRKHL